MIDFVRCAFRVSIRKACRALPAYRTTYPLPVSPTRASISVRKCIREIAVKRHPELTPALPHQKCYRTNSPSLLGHRRRIRSVAAWRGRSACVSL